MPDLRSSPTLARLRGTPAARQALRARAAWRRRRSLGPRLGRYTPVSMLQLPAHEVAAAHVPAIDVHNHLGRWLTPTRDWSVPDVGALVALMDEVNLAAVVNLDGRWGDELEANLARYDRAHPGRFATFCHLDWRLLREPGATAQLVAQLERSADQGARGLKVWKDLGLSVTDARGELVLPDDPRLAPVWDAAGRLGIPVLIHTGDPLAFYQPVDHCNERLEELLRHPSWSLHGKPVPPLPRLLDGLEAIADAHPGTTFVGAHVAGLAEDLGWVRAALAAHPNLHVDLSGRVPELGRQPRAAHALFVDHPRQVLFGTDDFPPHAEQLAITYRFLETADEAFEYTYLDLPPQGRWTISGLDLPEDVLAAVYAGNARRIVPGLRAWTATDGDRGPDGRPLRVLYSFPHRIGAPGIATTAFHQVEGLVEQGVEVTLVCAGVARPVPGVARLVTTLQVGGRRIPHRALGVDRAYAWHDRVVAAMLRRGRGRPDAPDVVHAWPSGCQRTFGAARAAGARSFREAPSPHTAAAMARASQEAETTGIPLPPGHSHQFDAVKLAREEAEFRTADVILAPSPYARDTFLDRGHAPDQVALHRYGYDPARFHAASPERPTSGGLVAAFVGRGEPNKGLHHALAAWHASGAPEAGGRLLICGKVQPDYAAWLEEGLAHPSVEQLGFVDDVGAVLRGADVLVLPTVTEGSALVTFEAQACGAVLAVSDAAGAVFDHGVHGFEHRAGDVDALTAHLAILATDHAQLARFRAATLDHARSLTWSDAGQVLVGVYRRHLAGSPGGVCQTHG